MIVFLCCMFFCRFRRPTYVTPKSFLSFLEGYKKIYSSKHEQIQIMAKRMNVGLAKLVEAGISVEELKKDLEIKEKDIAIANADAEAVNSFFSLFRIKHMILIDVLF